MQTSIIFREAITLNENTSNVIQNFEKQQGFVLLLLLNKT